MADLSRSIGAFSKTPILGWNGSVWVDTGLTGKMQVYDRFITERDFGQRKRILTLAGDRTVAPPYGVLRLLGASTIYLLESIIEDVDASNLYATTWALHEAAYPVQLCKMATESTRSGVKVKTSEQVVETTWVDITRYSAVDSKEFTNTDYTIYTAYFAKGIAPDTDMYLRRLDNGEVLDINEVFQALELPAARCLRRG
jgi:hypothetical protein